MKPAKKVILNTSILYAQLIIGMAIGLFTTRIVLDALGVTNYGIYMLVAGVVGMLGILNSNMANTSMRYMAHSLGSGNKETIRKTFNTTLYLHFIIGAIVIVLMQIGGWIMFEFLLNIPPDKIFDAKVVFHFMVITTFITVMSVPYDAVMNAHENMIALALVEIFGHILRLGIAIYLTYSQANLLILYGFLMLIIQVLLSLIKLSYSRVKYDECKISFRAYVEKKLIKEILAFTGWNLFGSIAYMSDIQVRGVLLNMFFGVSLNAAVGISQTATSQLNMISVSLTRAINPQLIKSEGGGDRERMLRITLISAKFSAFLFALFAIPVLMEANYLLNLWLKDVPAYTVVFCQLIIVAMLVEKFTFQITTAIRAVGNIRNFQLVETLIIVCSIPAAYFAFKSGYGPSTIFIFGILFSFAKVVVRLYFGKKVANLGIRNYLKNAILVILIPILLATPFAFLFNQMMPESFFRLIIVSFVFMFTLSISFWMWSLKREEKDLAQSVLTSLIQKIKSS